MNIHGANVSLYLIGGNKNYNIYNICMYIIMYILLKNKVIETLYRKILYLIVYISNFF